MILLTSITGLVAGAIGALCMKRYASGMGMIDNPNQRSSHLNPTPRGGGIGLVPAFIFAAIWSGVPFSFWLSVLLLSMISFYDDFSPLSSRSRLVAQLLLAFLIVAGGQGSLSPWDLLLVPFWVLFITGTSNFYNFMDGINGIAGLTGIASFGLLAEFSYLQTGSADPVVLALLFACVGFIPFNFPYARVFMGDVGSVLLGFSFAGFVFIYSQDLPAFLCLVSFLFLFYADTFTTLLFRLYAGERLTQAHRRHLYQVLCNEGGITHWKVSLGYFLIQILVGVMMLVAWQGGMIWQIMLLCICSFVFALTGLKIRRGFVAVD